MNHHTTKDFWRCFNALPVEVQALARKNYQLLQDDPSHPSLHFKKVKRLWSVRVGLSYRALAIERDQTCIWFWIGHHDEYDKLISN